MLDKLKELRKLQKQTKEIQKKLEKIHIEAEENGIIVIINGKQEVKEVQVPEEICENPKKMNKSLVKAFNKALKKSQEIGAKHMKEVMGGLGLPGM